jgi:hypothetical protein
MTPTGASDGLDAETVRYYAARADEYDDWYLRSGRYSHSPVDDAAWQSDLEAISKSSRPTASS